MEIKKTQISQNFQNLMEEISICATKANRSISEIKLIVVTKNQSAEKIIEVLKAGAKYIGENYPEETIKKWNLIENVYKEPIEVHLIGHLQSRKIQLILNRFSAFHALDSIRLAEKINFKITQEKFKPLPIFLQFNVSGENEKFGWQADEEKNWPYLCTDIERLLEMKGLNLLGLMTMPPFVYNSEENRKYFERLRRLRDFFIKRYPEIDLPELSMGTSQDFNAAIKEGATYLRIGTLIMGNRIQID